MLLKELKNKEKCYIQEDIATVVLKVDTSDSKTRKLLVSDGQSIPANTKIKIVNMLHATAIIDILPHHKRPGIDQLVYKRCIVKSEALWVKIKKTK